MGCSFPSPAHQPQSHSVLLTPIFTRFVTQSLVDYLSKRKLKVSNVCLLIIVLFLFATNRVAKKKKENMMNEENLSIVFGPTLMRAPDSDSIDILNDMKCQRLVIENLITCQDVLFES